MINFDKKILSDKRNSFIPNIDTILCSNVLQTKFIKEVLSEEFDNIDNFVKLSLYVDKITVNCPKMTSHHKELIVESLWSEYEFLSEKLPDVYKNFDDFYKELNSKLTKISEKEILNGNKNTFGFTKGKTIVFKDSLEDIPDEADEIYVKHITHEINHAFSNSSKSTGLCKKLFNVYRKEYVTNEYETEYLASKVLESNFPNFNKLKAFNLNLQKEDGTKSSVNMKTSLYNYKEGSLFIEAFNTIFGDEVIDTYYRKENSLSNIFYDNKKYSKELKKSLKTFISDFTEIVDTVKNYEDLSSYSLSEKSLNKLENSFLSLCLNLRNEHIIMNSDIPKIKDSLSRDYFKTVEDDFSFGEKVSKKLEILLTNDYIPSNNEVIDILNKEIGTTKKFSEDVFEVNTIKNKDKTTHLVKNNNIEFEI